MKYYKNRQQQHIDVVDFGKDTKKFTKMEFSENHKREPRWRQIGIALGGEGWHKKMKLDKVEVKPEDILPDISFYGETYHDQEQLPKIADIKSLAIEAIYRLGVAMSDTRDRYELSAKDIYNTSEQAIKDIREYLGDFDDEENVLTLSSDKDISLELVLVNNKVNEYRVTGGLENGWSYWLTDFEEAINSYDKLKIER